MRRRGMASEYVSSLMSKLSVKQKASLCSGSDFWRTQRLPINNVPSIMMTDGPHGLRKQESVEGRSGGGDSREATCFPPAATTANSFNVELMNAIGRAIGDAAGVMFTAGFSDSIPTSLTQQTATLPLSVYFQLLSPSLEVQDRAYAAAVVLTLIVLALSIGGRIIMNRFSRNKIQ